MTILLSYALRVARFSKLPGTKARSRSDTWEIFQIPIACFVTLHPLSTKVAQAVLRCRYRDLTATANHDRTRLLSRSSCDPANALPSKSNSSLLGNICFFPPFRNIRMRRRSEGRGELEIVTDSNHEIRLSTTSRHRFFPRR